MSRGRRVGPPWFHRLRDTPPGRVVIELDEERARRRPRVEQLALELEVSA